MLSIQLLGPPQLLLNDRALSISRRKSRALLFYLAAQPGPVLRDQLLALLWPDQDRASAQQVLRTSLYGLRKELGPAIEAADDTLALAPATVVDACCCTCTSADGLVDQARAFGFQFRTERPAIASMTSVSA